MFGALWLNGQLDTHPIDFIPSRVILIIHTLVRPEFPMRPNIISVFT